MQCSYLNWEGDLKSYTWLHVFEQITDYPVCAVELPSPNFQSFFQLTEGILNSNQSLHILSLVIFVNLINKLSKLLSSYFSSLMFGKV